MSAAPLGPALLLHHLHQHDLAAPDHFLNLVLAADAWRPLLGFLEGVGASYGFDRFRRGGLVVFIFIFVLILGKRFVGFDT
ncbi:hypothetical protein HC891_20760 [Candidatus Gracilibacteria bacterium]|nr:hypothetical protein [Candidatus Gracilibacteria bacterium]